MKSLENQKKLVATEVMGWKVINIDGDEILFKGGDKEDENNYLHLEDMYNPQSDKLATCKDWQEIFGNMSEDLLEKFIEILSVILKINQEEGWIVEEIILMLKSTPSQKWKALIEAIESAIPSIEPTPTTKEE